MVKSSTIEMGRSLRGAREPTSKVAEGVADKDPGREEIELEQSKGDSAKWLRVSQGTKGQGRERRGG
jgi:hypothetical protein